MTERSLDVSLNGAAVGRLSENNDLWEFTYAASWQNGPDAFDLSPALPRSARTHQDGGSLRPVQWYFDNLLPEEALRTVLAKEASVASEDAFGLLTWFGAESAGALVLRDPAAPEPADHGLKPLPLRDLSRRIEALPRVSLSHDAPKRMSLAGAQHKLLVVMRDGALFEPLPATPSTHILKPEHPEADYPHSVMNEYFTMRLARAVGLEVPPVHRLYVPQPVYVVERFDRITLSGQEEPQRLHVIDTCQLLNKSRSFKYTAARLDALDDAVKLCRARAAVRQRLFRWLVFNLLVGNGDNHLKNISFTVDAEGINLAPAYDMLSTASYETPAMADQRARWPATALALSLDGAGTFAQITRATVINAAMAMGVAADVAARELDTLRKSVPAEAERLEAEIAAGMEADFAASPDPAAARMHGAGELRLLRTIRYIVIATMVFQTT